MRRLETALKRAAQTHGAPTVGRYRNMTALLFGDYDQVVFAVSGLVYRFDEGHYNDNFGLTDVVRIHKAYMAAHDVTYGVKPIDTLAWYAERDTKAPPLKRCDLRCYERRFSTACRWASALVDAQRHAALNALAADHDANVQDHRAYMMGMG